MVSHDFVTSHRKTYDSHYSRKSIEHDSFNNAFRTAATELRIQNVVRFPTGCKSLDNLLDGGIEALLHRFMDLLAAEKRNSVTL